jgi:hypothetical protein
MWLWGEEGLEEPPAIMNLPYVSDLFEGSDAFPHNWNFSWAIKNFLDRYWRSGARVDDALIIADGRKCPALVKDTPVFLYDIKQGFGILG